MNDEDITCERAVAEETTAQRANRVQALIASGHDFEDVEYD